MQTELEAGSWKVIGEARESGNVGLFRSSGEVRSGLVEEILTEIPFEKIIWEAPQKAQQVWFIKLLGANVNLGNIAAALKEQFNWLWVGFYLVKEDELVLGPFQGPVACTRIRKGRGVCGSSWADAKTLIVADVEKFPGHIACSSLSRSEIVVSCSKNKYFFVLPLEIGLR